MGLSPDAWSLMDEDELRDLVRVHFEVKRVEDEKWDNRVKAILKALRVRGL